MAALKDLTPQELLRKVERFDISYVRDWEEWLAAKTGRPSDVASKFGEILRRWQACRPNVMRRSRRDEAHAPPYLEDLIEQATGPLSEIGDVEMRSPTVLDNEVIRSLRDLWSIFTDLSYEGNSRNGLSGVVGISKAILLMSEGRIGPAFDSEVRRKLGTGEIRVAEEWIEQLKMVARDIEVFEQKNGCRLSDAVSERFRGLHYGRLYDMAFGPGDS